MKVDRVIVATAVSWLGLWAHELHRVPALLGLTPDGDLFMVPIAVVLAVWWSRSRGAPAAGALACAYGPYVYSDAWNSGISSHTEGASDPYYGQTDVCLSGGLTGQDCANTVTATNTYLGGTGWGPGFFTTEQLGKGAAGEGDSGGPTYNHTPDGGNTAMGVIQVVPVADDATVAYLGQHYGLIVIGEWLIRT